MMTFRYDECDGTISNVCIGLDGEYFQILVTDPHKTARLVEEMESFGALLAEACDDVRRKSNNL